MSTPIKVIEVNDALIVGEVEIYTVDWTPEGTPSAAVAVGYIKGESTDLTSVLFAGGVGTCTMSGAIATLPAITVRAGDGAKTYRIVISATIGSRTRKIAVEIPISAPWGE